MAGEESEEVPGQRNVSSWPFRIACRYYVHQLNITTWVPLPSNCMYMVGSPHLLIIRPLKSGTAKTVPAVLNMGYSIRSHGVILITHVLRVTILLFYATSTGSSLLPRFTAVIAVMVPFWSVISCLTVIGSCTAENDSS